MHVHQWMYVLHCVLLLCQRCFSEQAVSEFYKYEEIKRVIVISMSPKWGIAFYQVVEKWCRTAISDFVTVSSLCHLVRARMAAGNAQIGKLAPDFTAKAVMPDGQFQDLKLSDYRGTRTRSFALQTAGLSEAAIIVRAPSNAGGLTLFSLLWCRKIRGLFLLPAGLHLRVPHRDNCVQRRRRRFQENRMRGHRSLRWLALLPFRLVATRLFVDIWVLDFGSKTHVVFPKDQHTT